MMLNIISHQRNANQSYSETLPDTTRMAIIRKKKTIVTSVGEGVETESSSIAVENTKWNSGFGKSLAMPPK